MKNKAIKIVLLITILGLLYFFLFKKKEKLSSKITKNPSSNGESKKPIIKDAVKPIYQTYTAVSGDTLSKIAIKNKVLFSNIVAANPQIKNVNIIKIGQKINIPTIKIHT